MIAAQRNQINTLLHLINEILIKIIMLNLELAILCFEIGYDPLSEQNNSNDLHSFSGHEDFNEDQSSDSRDTPSTMSLITEFSENSSIYQDGLVQSRTNLIKSFEQIKQCIISSVPNVMPVYASRLFCSADSIQQCTGLITIQSHVAHEHCIKNKSCYGISCTHFKVDFRPIECFEQPELVKHEVSIVVTELMVPFLSAEDRMAFRSAMCYEYLENLADLIEKNLITDYRPAIRMRYFS